MTTEDAHKRQLYNRQEYVVGSETQAKYAATDVLLVGLSGLGCEIAKNLVLTGIRSLCLLDNAPLQLSDLSTNFLAEVRDVGKNRADVAQVKLAEMNRFVTVSRTNLDMTEDLIKAFHVVIFVDHCTTRLLQENNWARRHHVKFVACESRGISGCIFVDGGDEHQVIDASGEETVSCILTGVTQDGSIVCHEDKKHECEVGSQVYFTGVEAPTFLNSDDTPSKNLFTVNYVTGPFGLKIDCPELLTAVCTPGSNAYMHTTKKTVTMRFLPLEESVKRPSFNFILDADAKMCAPSQLHEIYRLVHANDGHVPRDPAWVAQMVSTLHKDHQIDDEVFSRAIVESFGGHICPLACIIGGLATQEALKLTSGKFSPLDQWFYFDARELIPLMGNNIDRSPTDTRQDGQIQALGRELNAKLASCKAFIVGAGALGCEHIKNAAVMGFSNVSITDMDTIEVSNLSRQFLFRNWHVGQPKARVAAQAASCINPTMSIQSFEEKVCRETEQVFTEAFWQQHTVVLNALDNVPARMYVDEQCVFYKRPLFESGTLGTKCNSQVVIPYLTESYGSSADPPEKSVPLCTLKHFPNAIEHTIQWSQDLFHQLFSSIPSDVKRYLEDPSKFIATLESDQATKPLVIKSINDCLGTWPRSFADCVAIARAKFDEHFDHAVRQLLHNFPLDKVNERGDAFWSGARKPPRAITFDSTNDLHVAFVHHSAALLAAVFGIQHERTSSVEVTAEVASKIPSRPFHPVVAVYPIADAGAIPTKEVDSQAESTVAILPCDPAFASSVVTPVEFEKDDDSNHHIDFITAASNLRALNYGIPNADRSKTKLIAGKIIPAMVTTTSLVTGLVMLEVIKFVGGESNIMQYRNAFVNIALPSFVFSDPVPAVARQYARPDGSTVKWTMWDRIDVDIGSDATVRQLVDHLTSEHQLEVFMIALPSGKTIFSMFGSKKDFDRPVRSVAEDRGAQLMNISHLMLVVSGSFGDVDADVPTVRFRI